jgi:predicted nucleic acid-binding protein
LSEMLSLTAANLSVKHSLPMADAIVYATAELLGCQVGTSDKHFKGLANAIYISSV